MVPVCDESLQRLVVFFVFLQRINPSAEMVMIDRMFNQEERASLTRDKRLALVDPGKECLPSKLSGVFKNRCGHSEALIAMDSSY